MTATPRSWDGRIRGKSRSIAFQGCQRIPIESGASQGIIGKGSTTGVLSSIKRGGGSVSVLRPAKGETRLTKSADNSKLRDSGSADNHKGAKKKDRWFGIMTEGEAEQGAQMRGRGQAANFASLARSGRNWLESQRQ